MSKVIAVCGSPSSGKTTTALKLAQELYLRTQKPVLFFSVDLTVPAMGFLFPHRKEADLFSVGKVLDKTDVYPDDVLRNLVMAEGMPNLGYLGFKVGENKYSYPRPTEDKIGQLFCSMRNLAAYTVVDSVSDSSDLLSAMARKEAELLLQVASPDIKCMAYYLSHEDLFAGKQHSTLPILNIPQRDVYLPIADMRAYFGSAALTLPYSHALKQQSITGTLSHKLMDRLYTNAMAGVVKAVI